MQIVLIRPQIANNTGNIIRLCANIGASLHLVEPLGFDLDDARMRRAGLDYHELTKLHRYGSVAELPAPAPAHRWTFTTNASERYDHVAFGPDDQLVFGSEQPGLTATDHDALAPATALTIPMRPNNRSLNLANAVAIVAYEAWRQADFAGAAPKLGMAAAEPGETGRKPGETGHKPGETEHGLTAEGLTQPPFDA